jgi:uncharacterized protein YbjT (DUF2867 family)
VVDALVGAYGVVNAVSLYVEQRQETFHSVHVEAAQRVAAQALRAGVERLVQVSGIGSDAASPSLYIRKRGEGELAVRAAFADAILIRPAVMVGPDDSFLTTPPTLLAVHKLFSRLALTRRRLSLDVEPQQVVLSESESVDGCFGLQAAVRSMPIVAMKPDRQVSFSMI